MKTPVQQLIGAIQGLANKGARFASLVYQSKESGEVAKHTVALGVNLGNAYRRDLKMLQTKLPTLSGVDSIACQELIASLQKSLEVGIGNNPAYTCSEAYIGIAPGVKLHVEKGELHVYGFGIRKEVLSEGTFKTVNSSAKTLAKNKLRKGMKSGKFRQFALSALEVAKLEGKTLSFA